MTRFAALVRKELLELFATPTAYATVAVFWFASGFFFSFSLLFLRAPKMVSAFHNLTLLLLLLAPILTMRSVAEERQRGTLELLQSLPLGDARLVAAKYAGLLILLALLLVGSAVAVIPLALYAQPDPGPIVGGYLGLALFGAAVLALGLLVSACCASQAVAAVGTWGLLLGLWFVDYGAHASMGPAAALFRHLSLSLHTRTTIRGVLDGASAVYLVSLAVVALVWATQVLRWRRV